MAKKETPLVSVIIPGYNHAPYLRKRIDSVLAQDFDDYEVILLDDCSPDNSAEIMLSYKEHPKVRHVIINERNGGNTFYQWEKGILLAAGKYVWIAESDDVAEVRFLSALVRKMELENAVMAYCYSRLIDAEDNIMPANPNRTYLYRAPGVYDGVEFVQRRLSITNLVYNASMVVWRKDCYQNINKAYKDHRHAGDWLFWFEICRQGMVVEVPEYLSFFRQHRKKVSVNADNTGAGYQETGPIQEYILDELQASGFQRRVVRGRMTQRMKKNVSKGMRKDLAEKHPRIYNGSLLDVVCYNLDKKLNISGFQYKKRLFGKG